MKQNRETHHCSISKSPQVLENQNRPSPGHSEPSPVPPGGSFGYNRMIVQLLLMLVIQDIPREAVIGSLGKHPTGRFDQNKGTQCRWPFFCWRKKVR